MESRKSPNLKPLLEECDMWFKKLEGNQKKYQLVLEAVDFVDYIDEEVARVLIDKTGNLLDRYKDRIEEFDSAVCEVGCEASRDRSKAMRLLEEFARKPVYTKPDRFQYEGNHEELIF